MAPETTRNDLFEAMMALGSLITAHLHIGGMEGVG